MEKLPLSPYNPNASGDTAYYLVDKHGMAVVDTDNKGLGDSIGRTKDMYFVYNDPKFITAIENCWQHRPEFNNKLVGIRHPDYVEPDDKGVFHLGARMSRDHYINTLVALKMWEDRSLYKSGKLKEIVKATPFGIRHMARWTLSLILWSKSLTGNNWALWWYLVLEWLQINLMYRPLHWLGGKIAKWGDEVDQDVWETYEHNTPQTNLQHHPKWKHWISKITLPAYAIGFSSSQLYVTPNRFPKLKKAVQKSLLKMVGKTNYVQQMKLGKTGIPRDKVEAFKTMRGGRWGGYLNHRNDRNMQAHPEGRYVENLVDVDTVRYLYNETQL